MYNIISVNGQAAVDYGYRVTNGKCYDFIRGHNCHVRVEVVIDDNGTYNGYSNKWVEFIPQRGNVDDVINMLISAGLGACYAVIAHNCGELDVVDKVLDTLADY